MLPMTPPSGWSTCFPWCFSSFFFWHLKMSLTFYRASNICLNQILPYSASRYQDNIWRRWEEGLYVITKGCKQYCNYLFCDLLCTAVCCWSGLLRPPEDEKNISHSSQPVRTTAWIQMPAPHTPIPLLLSDIGICSVPTAPNYALCTISRPHQCVNDQQKSSEV